MFDGVSCMLYPQYVRITGVNFILFYFLPHFIFFTKLLAKAVTDVKICILNILSTISAQHF